MLFADDLKAYEEVITELDEVLLHIVVEINTTNYILTEISVERLLFPERKVTGHFNYRTQ